MRAEADVIIIGAGHNGLIAGAYLARAGVDVLVVEANAVHGGMTGTAAMIPEAPQHRINFCALDMSFIHSGGILTELEAARFGYREVHVEPEFTYLHPEGGSISIWTDRQRTVNEIARFSRRDAAEYASLMDDLDALIDVGVPMMNTNPVRPAPRAVLKAATAAARKHRHVRRLPTLMAGSLFGTIDERFAHPVVRDAMAAMTAIAGPGRGDGTAMNLMLLAWYHRFGATRVVGGTQGLADALLGAFESHGGRLRCAAPVQEILVDRGEACGVRLENGETLLARQGVLATPDPRMTLNTLLPSGSMDHRMERRAAHIAQYAVGVAPFMVHMAFSGQLTLDRFQRERKDDADLRVSTCFLGSFEGAYAGDIDAAAGRIPKEITVLCALPTAADPSQAPAGQDTAYVYACPMPLHPVEGWEVARPLAAQATVDRLTEYYEGIEELELGRWPESPADLAERMRVTNGCLWHVDLSPTRMGPLRPAAGLAGYRMPVPRLYHGGGGSHPNSSVSGMPGKLAAETLLRDMRRRPSHQPSAEFQHELSGAGDDRRPVAPLAAGPR